MDGPPAPDAAAPDALIEDLPFPADFHFGAAVAGFQVDMGCPTIAPEVCEDRRSDWYQFITDARTADQVSGDPPSMGPGHYELYEADLDLAVAAGFDTFRTSIEWSRLFPNATDDATTPEALAALADPTALAHYHAYFAAIRERGLEPMVTLNHYTLPLWIHDGAACHVSLSTCSPRGWLDAERTIREIAKYAGFAAAEFGDDVDLWITENEPFAVVVPAYLQPGAANRKNPPSVGLKFDAMKTAAIAMIEAHARMVDAIRAGDLADADGDGTAQEVGLVFAFAPLHPDDPEDPIDVMGAANAFYLYVELFMNAVALGELDDDLDGVAEHREDLAGRMDFVGINYYARATLRGTDAPAFPDLSPLTTFNPLSITPDWDYPRGIEEMVAYADAKYGVPIWITENGTGEAADPVAGPRALVRHLTWLARAIRDGADVRGYLWWTMMDNYEWNQGMEVRMGLYAVDPADPTKARTARTELLDAYRAIIDSRSVPADLQARFPATP